MKIAYVIIGAVVLVGLAGAGGFFGGMTYAQSQAQNTASDFARQRAIQGGQGNGTGGQNSAGGANNPCGFGGFGGFQGNGGTQGAQGGSTSGAGQANQTGGQGSGEDNNAQGSGHRQGGGQFGGQFGGFAALGNCVARGQIKSVDGGTVQISTADSVVTVKVSDSTVISKTDRGTISDLHVGDRVTVFSQETGDSPTASNIQLQPAPPATATP